MEIRYSGAKGKRAAIEINNLLFKNNLIEQSGLADFALFASSQIVEDSVIRDNSAVGIFCEHDCQILSNIISANAGDALVVDVDVTTEISGNLFFKNGDRGGCRARAFIRSR